MPLEVHRKFFSTKEQVFDDLKQTGFFPTTYVSTPSPEIPVHWHDCEVHGYVIEGQSTILDAERGEYIVLETGDKLVIPPGTLHAEGEVKDTMVFIVALPEARPFDRFLQTLPPDDPNRPGA